MIREIKKGVTLHTIQTKKFKEICISINFITKNTVENATHRALLAMMFTDRTSKYDTKKKMSQVSDHLYGCTLGSRVLTYGKSHCLEIRSKVINPIYIHESNNLLNDWLNLLHEVIFNPLMIQNKLSGDLLEENRKNLLSKILRKEDDAQSYVVEKVFELAGKNQPLGIKPRGEKDLLKKITVNDVTQQYHQLIDNNQIEILICGDFDEMQMISSIQSKFPFEDRDVSFENEYMFKSQQCVYEKNSRLQSQSNLALLYATNTKITDEDYPILKVVNGLLGQLPSSYLFQVVREQYSLCYSIYSSLVSYDGACLITTGVEKEKIDQALELIDQQLRKCQKGDISLELLETTKQMLINSLKTSLDEMGSILGYNLNNALLKRKYSIEKNIEDIQGVTIDDCVKVFNKFEKAACFICESQEVKK